MKRLFLVVALATIAGCSTGDDGEASCFTTYSYEYDQVGETGLTLKATGSEFAYLSFDQMEEEYIDLEACAANTNTPGPNVEFISFDNSPYYQWSSAIYYYAIRTVFIDTDDHAQSGSANLIRNCISDRELLRHEFMHHVLFLNGEDPGHTNPKFGQCKALGPKTCNGEYCE